MSGFKVYQDLAERTNGEFYLGVCGPVRTGKSTFIKRFMELMVIPGIEDENEKKEQQMNYRSQQMERRS